MQCGAAAAAALHSQGSNDSPLASQLLQELPELHLHFLAGRNRGKGALVPGENEGGERSGERMEQNKSITIKWCHSLQATDR